jgi:hypothetical protein
VELNQPRDLPGVPRHLQRHSIIRPKARGEQLDLLGLGLDPASRAYLTILDDRDLAEIQVHAQRHRPHRNHLL